MVKAMFIPLRNNSKKLKTNWITITPKETKTKLQP